MTQDLQLDIDKENNSVHIYATYEASAHFNDYVDQHCNDHYSIIKLPQIISPRMARYRYVFENADDFEKLALKFADHL